MSSDVDADAQLQRVRDLLARSALFAELQPAHLDQLARGVLRLQVAPGEVIVHRGAPSQVLHLLVYGQVKLACETDAGAERVLRLIGPGESFGEESIFLSRTSLVNVQALTDALLLRVPRDVLWPLVDRDVRLARALLVSLSRQVYMLTGDVSAYTLRNGLQRVIGYLFRASTGTPGEPFRIEVNKGVIASRLNLTPEHFSRILRELSERGLIRVQGREFTILDEHALRDYHG